MTRIAFIGLGIMGGPMAANLADAGHHVLGFNRSTPRSPRVAESGVVLAGSVESAVTDAEVVATMLPDSPDVQAVLGEAFASAPPDALFVDFSTIRPDVARELAATALGQGRALLDAPVSGGEQGAVDGSLSVMVGGDAAAFDRARPLLDVVGATVVHVGEAGAGQTVKAANQLIVAGTLCLVAEAVTFLEASGVDTDKALTVLKGGLAGSAVLERKSSSMVRREYDPGFRLTLHHKDMGIYTATARAAGVASPTGAIAAQLVASAVAQGYGDLDHSALLRLVEQLSGRSGR
ncbi:MAG: NAD(P)-dependent oxidoreductase [Nocardioides sp.]